MSDVKSLSELEGPRGGRAWFVAGQAPFRKGRNLRWPRLRWARGGSCRLYETIIAYWYSMSIITCKWFGCREMASFPIKWRLETLAQSWLMEMERMSLARQSIRRASTWHEGYAVARMLASRAVV